MSDISEDLLGDYDLDELGDSTPGQSLSDARGQSRGACGARRWTYEKEGETHEKDRLPR